MLRFRFADVRKRMYAGLMFFSGFADDGVRLLGILDLSLAQRDSFYIDLLVKHETLNPKP